jgi:hypothetical protein
MFHHVVGGITARDVELDMLLDGPASPKPGNGSDFANSCSPRIQTLKYRDGNLDGT